MNQFWRVVVILFVALLAVVLGYFGLFWLLGGFISPWFVFLGILVLIFITFKYGRKRAEEEQDDVIRFISGFASIVGGSALFIGSGFFAFLVFAKGADNCYDTETGVRCGAGEIIKGLVSSLFSNPFPLIFIAIPLLGLFITYRGVKTIRSMPSQGGAQPKELRKIKIAGSILLVLLALMVMTKFYNPIKHSTQNLIADHYRPSPNDTYLGTLPVPLKIYSARDGKFIGATTEGQFIDLELPRINADMNGYGLSREVYFDKLMDRVFYWSNGQLKVLDIKTGRITSIQLPEELTSNKEIAGVHRNYIAFRDYEGFAAIADFKIYDMGTRKLLDYKSSVASGDYANGHNIVIGNKSYGFYWEYKKGLSGFFTGNTTRPKDKLTVYLVGEPASIPEISGLPSGFAENIQNNVPSNVPNFISVFRIGDFPKLGESSLTLKSKGSEPTFRMRSLFLLDEKHLLQEADNGLIMIDLGNKTARYTENREEIARSLLSAILIAPSIENNYSYSTEAYCEFVPFTRTQYTDKGDFVFCLE